jgi:adenosine deaminase CECR1
MFPTIHNDFNHYKKERAALISHDRSLRADYAQVLSETEVKADRVVREIRVAEAASIWGAKHPDIAHPFPG